MLTLAPVQNLTSAELRRQRSNGRKPLPETAQVSYNLPGITPLQRKSACACGGSCPKCQAKELGIQPKLTIGAPNDQYEQEADRVADQVMSMPDAQISSSHADSSLTNSSNPYSDTIQRQDDSMEEEDEAVIQEKTTGGNAPEITPTINSGIQSLQGGGQPLSNSERHFFEPRFGTDFSKVRIHNDNKAANTAQAINARAFTLGNNVVFGTGEYAPDSSTGKKLLAHELTHVVQQTGRSVDLVVRRKVVDNAFHVPCRTTRPDAVERLRQAEERAIMIARRAANLIDVHTLLHPLMSALGESPEHHQIRDALWRRFHLDLRDQNVRDRVMPLWARRYRLVADWIHRLNHRYVCDANGVEPAGTCRNRPGVGMAWTASGLNSTEICDAAWDTTPEMGETILHEWFHFGFDWLGDCEQRNNQNNAVCWDQFAAELSGTATVNDYAGCCAPPTDPLPPLV